MPDRVAIENVLKNTHLFRRMGHEQLENLIDYFDVVDLPSGQILFEQGGPADTFFIIFNGKVKITRRQNGKDIPLATLVSGDYFGEEALLTKRMRSATVVAVTDTVLLCLNSASFMRLLKVMPELYSNLMVGVQSHRLARQTQLEWLNKDEVVYYIARMHPFFLYLHLTPPVLLTLGVFISFILMTSAGWTSLTPFLLAGTIGAAGILWAGWVYLDWSNDYYIVTNQRVVYLEKVVGLYDSRNEAPLGTILSVGTKTSQVGRIVGYGEVNVRTFTGLLVFYHVAYPEAVASLVEEHWFRAKTSSKRAESVAMAAAIRRRLGLPDPDASLTRAGPALPLNQPRKPGELEKLVHNLYKMRFEEGGIVTYRKHWFILIQQTWLPTLFLILGLALMVARLTNAFTFLSIPTVMVLGMLYLLVMLAWYVYEYVDWTNDIYQITPEQVVDIDRTPFGREDKKAAPLENILSIQYERLGLVGLIFNFGTVSITVGGTKFTFDYVYNPSMVQQDVFRRMNERVAKKKQAEVDAERERVSEWFASFKDVVDAETRRRRLDRPSLSYYQPVDLADSNTLSDEEDIPDEYGLGDYVPGEGEF